MSILISFLIGIVVGVISTRFVLRQTQLRKIDKRQRFIDQYPLKNQRDHSRSSSSPQHLSQDENSKSSSPPPVMTAPAADNYRESQELRKAAIEIEAFLKSRDIQIKSIPPEQEADEVLGGIATFMGNRYSLIRKFYEKIKSNMDSGRGFKMNLKNDPQDKVSSICQLGHKLHQIAFLEEYYYQRSPRFVLSARSSKIPKALNFFSGQWLELFLREEIIKLIQDINPQLRYSYLLNPKIVLPNGDDFELDVIFKVEEEIFWFEAKTGGYQKYIEKYSRMSKLLGLNKDHSYMVLTGISETSAKALSSVFEMSVVDVENFSENFAKALEDFSSYPVESNEESAT